MQRSRNLWVQSPKRNIQKNNQRRLFIQSDLCLDNIITRCKPGQFIAHLSLQPVSSLLIRPELSSLFLLTEFLKIITYFMRIFIFLKSQERKKDSVWAQLRKTYSFLKLLQFLNVDVFVQKKRPLLVFWGTLWQSHKFSCVVKILQGLNM